MLGTGKILCSCCASSTSVMSASSSGTTPGRSRRSFPMAPVATTPYSNAPGSGRTGYVDIPPNNYDWYDDDEKYKPVVQADGGVLSRWEPMYAPTPEQAAADRKAAYEAGVPHGAPRAARTPTPAQSGHTPLGCLSSSRCRVL